MPRGYQKGHPNYYKGKYDELDKKLLFECVCDYVNGGSTPKARRAAAKKCGLAEATFMKYAEKVAVDYVTEQFGGMDNARKMLSGGMNERKP